MHCKLLHHMCFSTAECSMSSKYVGDVNDKALRCHLVVSQHDAKRKLTQLLLDYKM